MLRDAEVLAELMTRKADYTLPQAFYTDPGVFDADMRLIYYREWLVAGSVAEVPKTGSFITLQVGNYSVIIVRGADGEIRAFHNTCRHRGSRICQVARGTAPKLVCPYHQWTYELDGRLIFARDMGPNFDYAQHGLKPVHCRQAAGLLFICLAAIAPPFDAVVEQAERYVRPHHLEQTKVAHQSRIVAKGN
jgi:Rieske 2Fe-2S family protein